MFLFLAFLVVAGLYLAVEFVPAYLAYTSLVAVPVGLAIWLSDRTGVDRFMVHSFRYLSGVHNLNRLMQDFPHDKPTAVTFVLLLACFGLLLFTMITGAVAAVATPAGLLITFIGGVVGAFRRGIRFLSAGMFTLAFGLGAVILSGVILRFVHYLNLWAHHQPLPDSGTLIGPGVIAGITLIVLVIVQRWSERDATPRPARIHVPAARPLNHLRAAARSRGRTTAGVP